MNYLIATASCNICMPSHLVHWGGLELDDMRDADVCGAVMEWSADNPNIVEILAAVANR